MKINLTRNLSDHNSTWSAIHAVCPDTRNKCLVMSLCFLYFTEFTKVKDVVLVATQWMHVFMNCQSMSVIIDA